jgi:hypothetical protein
VIDRPTPNGCRHCGVQMRDHLQRWTLAAGWHGWTPPTSEQIKARMIRRRADRIVAVDLERHERQLAAVLRREAPAIEPRPALTLILSRANGGAE